MTATLAAAVLLVACGDGAAPASPSTMAKKTASASRSVEATLNPAFGIAWSNAPGGVDVAVDSAGNAYTATWVQGPGGDIELTKRNAAGAVQWTRSFDNTNASGFEAASGVAVDGAGNVFVSGTIRSGFSNPVDVNSLVMKFSADGTLLWRQVYDLAFDGSSTRRVLADAAGNAYVLGLNVQPPAGLMASVRQFRPDGSTGWTWFDGVGVAGPFDLKWGRDGSLLVTGGARARGGYAIVDPVTGATRFGGNVISSGGADIAVDSTGTSVFTAYTNATGVGGVISHRTLPFGGLWEHAVAMSPFRVEVDAAGNAIVSGFPATGFGAAFMKFAPDGTLLWSNQDTDGPLVNMLAHARMRLDAAGNAYLAGSTLSQTAVVRVNADGTTGWLAEFPGGGAHAMALGANDTDPGLPPVYTVVLNSLTTRINQGEVPPPPVLADLGITLADSPDPVIKGGKVVFTATIRNAGPDTAAGVRLDTVLPAGLAWRATRSSQGSCSGTESVTCDLGSLAPGAEASVTITTRARTVGTKTTTASVSATTTDPESGNNVASQSTTVTRR